MYYLIYFLVVLMFRFNPFSCNLSYIFFHYYRVCTRCRRMWRYQRGNQNPYIEKQTKQWPEEKVQRDEQRSTKHTYKTKDRVTRTQPITGGELRCSGRIDSSCSTSGIHPVNLVTNPVISQELFTFIEHLSSLPVLCCPIFSCLCSIMNCLSFSFGHGIVYLSSISTSDYPFDIFVLSCELSFFLFLCDVYHLVWPSFFFCFFPCCLFTILSCSFHKHTFSTD